MDKLGFHNALIDLGVVELHESISEHELESLKTNLLKSGLELLDNKRSILVEKIKNVIIELIHYSDELPKVNYS
ncbi:MAG: AraC family transcriptional regulator, partial [Cytophagia bacterium]|nr:AraC family transcriptional regulator [Cytophagia bacterium]